MTTVTWPTWLAWLIAIAILLTFLLVWSLARQVGELQANQQTGGIRNRRELEDAYTAGSINRDAYERLKNRLS